MNIRFLSKGPADQVSGGYLYNRYLMAYLRRAGVEVTYHADPCDASRFGTADTVIVDSLVIEEAAERLLSVRADLILLLHVVPDRGESGAANRPFVEALYSRSRIVVTGDSTLTVLRERLANAGIDAAKIEPGVPAQWRAKSRYATRARRLLTVANYICGKGVARVLEALVSLKHLPWTLTVHGNDSLDPRYFAAVSRKAADYGLKDRVRLLGPIPHDGVNDRMLEADLLVHLSRHESYSIVTAEAVACGLPVLSYQTGNFGVFGRSGLVEYLEHGASASEPLASLIDDEETYGRLRPLGVAPTRTWEDVGREFLAWMSRSR